MTTNELKQAFLKEYGGSADDIRFFSAAGRVNLIGEHVDYCGGEVFPAALNLRSLVAVRKTGGNAIKIAATTIDAKETLYIDKLNDYRDLKWGNYQAGVAYVMQNDGFTIVGCEMLYDSTVPFGSGLSSSASIEVATAVAINAFSGEAGGKTEPLTRLAVLALKAENEYAGVNCGIMDQFASAMGKKDNAILLNCKTLEYSYVPLKLGGYSLVIANTNKKRGLGDSKYNERRQECEDALAILQKAIPDIECLADISVEKFDAAADVLKGNGRLYDRAKHVVYECDRVKRSVEALKNNDIILFGKLLNESHYSLRDLYEVTGIELDSLTEAARAAKGCIGSRMTGAGFGGCTVSLVKEEDVPAFIDAVGAVYERVIGHKADFYQTSIEDGAFEERV